ncbi:MAG: hypothetical protein FVQ80_07085 [Planctomycetes bacterium]|nr:hypothetical protein [Planctomycetota bacterium]
MEEMKTVRLEELVEGSSLFQSKGVSTIKVTRDGVKEAIEIPIRSSGIAELVDAFSKETPTPPSINVLVKPDDEIGQELKLVKKQWVQILDVTDKAYREELDKHNSDLGMKIVLKGIDVVFKDDNGTVVDDDDRKVEILKGQGITGEQFSQIVEDISNLTKWEEDREDAFLEQ